MMWSKIYWYHGQQNAKNCNLKWWCCCIICVSTPPNTIKMFVSRDITKLRAENIIIAPYNIMALQTSVCIYIWGKNENIASPPLLSKSPNFEFWTFWFLELTGTGLFPLFGTFFVWDSSLRESFKHFIGKNIMSIRQLHWGTKILMSGIFYLIPLY